MRLDALRLAHTVSAYNRSAADSYLRMSEDAKKLKLGEDGTVFYDANGKPLDERFSVASSEEAEKTGIGEEDEESEASDISGKDDDKKTGDKFGRDGFLKDPPDCECETCRKRRYQDDSDDSVVSFQGPTRMSPQAAKSKVRSHELEHVRRESIKAKTQGKRVLSQTVRIRTATCEECGRVYVAGGTTTTVTRPDMRDFHNMFMLGFDEEDVIDKDVI